MMRHRRRRSSSQRRCIQAAALVHVTLTTTFVSFPIVEALSPPIHPASESLSSESSDMELFSLPPVVVTKAEEDPTPVDEPYKIALPNDVFITPETNGSWEETTNGTKVWRLCVNAPGATGVIVGFTKYRMPEGARLYVYARDGSFWLPPFSSVHNNPTRQLWLPMIPTNDFILEVDLPPSVKQKHLKLQVGAINSGFRAILPSSNRTLVANHDDSSRELGSGSCNVDVACPHGDDWRPEIRAVGSFSFTPTPNRGSLYCSGTMMNNARQDERNFFLTAHHCVSNRRAAETMTFYWNFETTTCGGTPDGSLGDFTTGGAMVRATFQDTDFTLLELHSIPDSSFGITYAGWDRTGKDAPSAVGIHHPQGCEKRISLEDDPTMTTGRFQYTDDHHSSQGGNFIRVVDWDVGTTEPGSSGSPLFHRENHKVIGQLLGGSAACGNDLSDWYGKFSKSWEGGGSKNTRLADWLDPDSTGVMTLDILDHGATPPTRVPSVTPSKQPSVFPSNVPSLLLSNDADKDCTNHPGWYFVDRKGNIKRCGWVRARNSEKRCRRNGRDNDSYDQRMNATVGCPSVCKDACQAL